MQNFFYCLVGIMHPTVNLCHSDSLAKDILEVINNRGFIAQRAKQMHDNTCFQGLNVRERLHVGRTVLYDMNGVEMFPGHSMLCFLGNEDPIKLSERNISRDILLDLARLVNKREFIKETKISEWTFVLSVFLTSENISEKIKDSCNRRYLPDKGISHRSSSLFGTNIETSFLHMMFLTGLVDYDAKPGCINMGDFVSFWILNRSSSKSFQCHVSGDRSIGEEDKVYTIKKPAHIGDFFCRGKVWSVGNKAFPDKEISLEFMPSCFSIIDPETKLRFFRLKKDEDDGKECIARDNSVSLLDLCGLNTPSSGKIDDVEVIYCSSFQIDQKTEGSISFSSSIPSQEDLLRVFNESEGTMFSQKYTRFYALSHESRLFWCHATPLSKDLYCVVSPSLNYHQYKELISFVNFSDSFKIDKSLVRDVSIDPSEVIVEKNPLTVERPQAIIEDEARDVSSPEKKIIKEKKKSRGLKEFICCMKKQKTEDNFDNITVEEFLKGSGNGDQFELKRSRELFPETLVKIGPKAQPFSELMSTSSRIKGMIGELADEQEFKTYDSPEVNYQERSVDLPSKQEEKNISDKKEEKSNKRNVMAFINIGQESSRPNSFRSSISRSSSRKAIITPSKNNWMEQGRAEPVLMSNKRKGEESIDETYEKKEEEETELLQSAVKPSQPLSVQEVATLSNGEGAILAESIFEKVEDKNLETANSDHNEEAAEDKDHDAFSESLPPIDSLNGDIHTQKEDFVEDNDETKIDQADLFTKEEASSTLDDCASDTSSLSRRTCVENIVDDEEDIKDPERAEEEENISSEERDKENDPCCSKDHEEDLDQTKDRAHSRIFLQRNDGSSKGLSARQETGKPIAEYSFLGELKKKHREINERRDLSNKKYKEKDLHSSVISKESEDSASCLSALSRKSSSENSPQLHSEEEKEGIKELQEANDEYSSKDKLGVVNKAFIADDVSDISLDAHRAYGEVTTEKQEQQDHNSQSDKDITSLSNDSTEDVIIVDREEEQSKREAVASPFVKESNKTAAKEKEEEPEKGFVAGLFSAAGMVKDMVFNYLGGGVSKKGVPKEKEEEEKMRQQKEAAQVSAEASKKCKGISFSSESPDIIPRDILGAALHCSDDPNIAHEDNVEAGAYEEHVMNENKDISSLLSSVNMSSVQNK